MINSPRNRVQVPEVKTLSFMVYRMKKKSKVINCFIQISGLISKLCEAGA